MVINRPIILYATNTLQVFVEREDFNNHTHI